MRRQLFLVLAAGLLAGADAAAADLSTIDRTIKKEPAYQAKPKYCLLVFGPEAKARVWLVLDGDVLYVDRNGNGDLTEDGERVQLPPFKNERKDGVTDGDREVRAGTLTVGPARYELMLMQARLRKDPRPASPEEAEMLKLIGPVADRLFTGVVVTRQVNGGGKAGAQPPADAQVAFADHRGVLQFGGRPQDAPIVHFNGPLRMTLHPLQKLIRGQEAE